MYDLVGDVIDDGDAYAKLTKFVERYKAEGSRNPEEADMKDPEEDADQAMDLIDSLFSTLGKVAKGARNRAYINEYFLTRFHSHNFNNDSYNLKNNEVEYIIYGLDGTGANYGAAIGEILLIRFAVNFLEAFTQPLVKGSGPFIWWAALAYAIEETTRDMVDLTNYSKNPGGEIVSFNRLRFTTDYKDYLRLILFMHPRGKQLERSMALINLNTNTDLRKRPTYVTGKATSSISLWFLPGITKMLGKTGIIDGKVKDGEYQITKKAVYSY